MHVLGDTTVHAHNFLINQGHQRDVVEAVTEGLEQRDFIPSLNLNSPFKKVFPFVGQVTPFAR